MIPFGRPETTTATTTTADSVNGMIHPTTESVSSKSFGRCADECRHASRPYALQPHPDHGCRRCGGFDFIQSVFWNGTIHNRYQILRSNMYSGGTKCCACCLLPGTWYILVQHICTGVHLYVHTTAQHCCRSFKSVTTTDPFKCFVSDGAVVICW